jgi:hypothetical protein
MPEIITHTDLIKTENIDVAELSRESLFVKPVDYDFSSENWSEGRADGTGWYSEEAAECEECHGVYVGSFSATCDNEECENYETEIAEDLGPMMNYYYPLESAPGEEGIRQLVDLPLCVVTIDGDRHALALTGGGMDLSWEICEAFMRLGMLPPLHFAGLPGMAGRGSSERDTAIVRACVASADAALEIMGYRAEGVRREAKSAATSEARRKIADGWPSLFEDVREGVPISTVMDGAREMLDDDENERLQPLLTRIAEWEDE